MAGSRSVAATLAALVGGLLGLLTCVLLSRIVTAAASAVLATRRGRDVAGVGGLLLFVMAGPLVSALSDGGLTRETMDRTATFLAWTPLGWAWAPAGDLALGQWGTGLTRLALAALLCLVLLVAWERLLVSVLRNPRSASVRRGQGLRRARDCSGGCRRRRWARSRRGPGPTGSATPASTSRRS